jgi:polyhydroxyalkanoate synthesis regulator phasin
MKIDDLAREIDLIKNNHLAHIAEDIDRLDKRLEKMDNRVWAILILLVGAVVLTFVKN